jgi:hypothetical protein
MVFQRGRTSKPQEPTGRRSRKSSQKSKAEDPEEDSQQEDADKEEHNDSNDTVNTQFKLNRQSILEFCAEYEAERRKQSAKKLPLLLDLLDDPQLGVLNVLFPGMECPPEWIAFQKKERARMRREAAKANAEYVPVPIVRKVSAFTYDHVIKFTRELQDKHIAVIKQDLELKQFLLEYDMTLIGMLRAFFGAHDPVQVRDELTDVRLVKTENGVLADVGQYVSEIYTTLQGIQLPDDELNLVKHLLKELAKTAPHLAGAFTADPTWYPSTIKEYTEYLLEMAKRQHESSGYFSDWMSPVVEEGRPTLEQYNKVCKEVKELKLRLKNEGRNRSESHGKPKFRHSEEQPMVQGKDQPIEGKERLIPSCTNCGKTGHSISNCWKKGGGAYQEDQPAPATKKLRSQLNPTNLKAQTAAITAMQSKFDKLCNLLEPLVKSQLEADQH